MTSYWIAHPTDAAFISALSPEGVVQPLTMAERWPVGRYPIRRHRHGTPPSEPDHRPWGHAVKGLDRGVRIEPAEQRAMGDSAAPAGGEAGARMSRANTNSRVPRE